MNRSKGSFNKGVSGSSKGSFNSPPKPVNTPRPSTPAPVPGPRPTGTNFTPPRPAGTQVPGVDLSARISSIQSQVNGLQNDARLQQTWDAIEDLQTTINGMPQRLANLRQNGYVFECELESQADNFIKQWAVLYPSLFQQLNSQSSVLLGSLRNIDSQMAQLNAQRNNPGMAQSLIATLEANVSSLNSQVSAAERSISGSFDQLGSQVSQVKAHLDGIEQMLKEFASATFQLLPTEGPLMTAKAVLAMSGKEQKGDPEGVLFLTDQRLLFEQRQEVVTKKVLFVATSKETVQKLLWESPVALVEQVKTSKQGLMKNEDHIDIQFASGAPARTIHFHIWQSADEWQGFINRARSKEFDSGRAVKIDQAEVDKVKSVPAQCPSCGGNLSQVVLRGQDNVKCEYCGFVIRL